MPKPPDFKPDATPPSPSSFWTEPHPFAPVTGPTKLCGFCGGGKDHPIHQGDGHER